MALDIKYPVVLMSLFGRRLRQISDICDVTAIFDDKLNKLDTPPTGNFISPVWLNDSTILYSSNYTVYRYDMNTGEDTALKEYQSDSVGRSVS